MEFLLIRNEVLHRGGLLFSLYHSIIVILQPPYYIYIYCGFGRGAQWFVIMCKSVPQCTNGMGWNTAEERT
jgi:hypothetical protein